MWCITCEIHDLRAAWLKNWNVWSQNWTSASRPTISNKVQYYPLWLNPSPPSPNSRALLPHFIQIAQMGLILRRWNLILPRTPPPTPFLYSAVTHPIQGYVRTKNTPKGPSPPKNTPFPDLNLKVGKMNYLLGNLYPNWAKCLKSGQNFSRSGQKNLFIYALNYWPIPNIDALGF